MIEGLHYLPRVQAQRAELADEGFAETFLECATCPLLREERRGYRCGYLPASEHTRVGPVPYPEADVCPGYTTNLPEVWETARALAWVNRGHLEAVYGPGQLPPFALDCIDLLDAAVKQVEREAYRKQREGMEK